MNVTFCNLALDLTTHPPSYALNSDGTWMDLLDPVQSLSIGEVDISPKQLWQE